MLLVSSAVILVFAVVSTPCTLMGFKRFGWGYRNAFWARGFLPTHWLYVSLAFVTLAVLPSAFVWARSDGVPMWYFILRATPFAVGIAGFVIAASAKRYFLGEPRCASCAYDVDALNAPAVCPECGTALLERGGSTVLRHETRENRRVPGYTIAGLGCGSYIVGTILGPTLLAPLPTMLLVPIAPYNDDVIRELANRQLTPDQILGIANNIAESRRSNDHLDREIAEWVADQIIADRLPDEFAKQWFDESAELWLEGPGTARVGEDVDLVIRGRDLDAGGFAVQSRLYLGPPSHGSKLITGPTEAAGYGLYVLGIENETHGSTLSILGPTDDFDYRLRLVPSAPGTLTFTWPAILAQVGARGATTITWDGTGEPTFSTPPLACRHITLTHTIEVAPP